MPRLLLLAAALALLVPAAHAQTCTTEWTGAADGDVMNFQNWTNGVPTPGAVGCIDGAGTSSAFIGARATGVDFDHLGVIVLGGESGQHTLSVTSQGNTAKVLFNQLLIRPTGTLRFNSGEVSGFIENRGVIEMTGVHGAPSEEGFAKFGYVDGDPMVELTNLGQMELVFPSGRGSFRGQLVNEAEGVIAKIGAGAWVFDPGTGPEPDLVNRGLITSSSPGIEPLTEVAVFSGATTGFGLLNEEGGRIEVTEGALHIDFGGDGARLEGGDFYAAEDSRLQFLNSAMELAGTLTGNPEGEVILRDSNTGGGSVTFDFGGAGVVLRSAGNIDDLAMATNTGILALETALRGGMTFVNEGLVRTVGVGLSDNTTFQNEVGATVEIIGDNGTLGSTSSTFNNRGRIVKTSVDFPSAIGSVLHNFDGAEICVEGSRLSITNITDELGALICGTGTFNGGSSYEPRGTIRPGLSPGTLGWFQNQTFTSDAILDFEIDGPAPGTEHDVLAGERTFTLGGTLKVRVANGYDPSIGTEFVIMTATSISGDFDALDLQTGLSHEVNADNVTIRVTGTLVDTEPDDVASLELAAGAPNPFRSWTTLELVVPEPTEVIAEVFDALGRQVAVLKDGVLPAGSHALRFEAEDLPSGVYVVRVQTADRSSASQRVTLLR